MKLKKYINIKELIKGIVVFILYYNSSYLQYIPIKLLNLDVKHLTSKQDILLSIFSSLIIAVVIFFIYRQELIKEWHKFITNFKEDLKVGFTYWFIGLSLMIMFNIIIMYVFRLGQANNEKAVETMIGVLPLAMLLDAGILAPFVEENVFRKTFKNAFPNKYLFIFLSAFVFGLIHVITSATSPLDYLYILPYASLGLSFAIMYYKTNTIYTSMFMHMFHNIILTSLVIFM
jgi:membrane protease YdiL (CAAX protease family)